MIDKLLEIMRTQGVDGYLVTKQENVRYFTGYKTAAACFLTIDGMLYTLIDPQYEKTTDTVYRQCEELDWRKYGSIEKTVEMLCKQEKIKVLAVEKAAVSLAFYTKLERGTGIPIKGMDGVFEQIRSIKTPEEIQYIRNACDITCKAFDMLLNDIRIGITEKELEAKLSYYMVTLGGDTKPNFNLLISGTRTSLLHGMPSSKSISYGDLILMDFGIEYKGYTSDMTRVVVAGKATQEQKELYATVNQMLENCLLVIRDGARAMDVCEASFGTIRGTKYESHYYPSIGHGVGLFVHEVPFLRPTSSDVLRENNVMAVEPGIFIPGWGGIHLEDNILVTKDGYENFTSTEKRLIEL